VDADAPPSVVPQETHDVSTSNNDDHDKATNVTEVSENLSEMELAIPFLSASAYGLIENTWSDIALDDDSNKYGNDDDELHDIEIIFDDGQAVLISHGVNEPGKDHTQQMDEMALVRVETSVVCRTTDGPDGIDFDKTTVSDAESLAAFLLQRISAGETPKKAEPLPQILRDVGALCILTLAPQPGPRPATNNPVSGNPHLPVSCVRSISTPVEGSVTVSRWALSRPCERFPRCDHARVQVLNRAFEAEEGFRVRAFLVFSKYEKQIQLIEPAPGLRVEVPVLPKCEGQCNHTLVEADDDAAATAGCLKPAYFATWFMCDSIGAEEDDDTDEDESDEDGSNEDESDDGANQSDDDQQHGIGPFRSVPCFFCRKRALRPTLEEEETRALVAEGTHSYGYRCARCRNISWVTGVRDQGLENAHEHWRPRPSTSGASAPQRQGQGVAFTQVGQVGTWLEQGQGVQGNCAIM